MANNRRDFLKKTAKASSITTLGSLHFASPVHAQENSTDGLQSSQNKTPTSINSTEGPNIEIETVKSNTESKILKVTIDGESHAYKRYNASNRIEHLNLSKISNEETTSEIHSSDSKIADRFNQSTTKQSYDSSLAAQSADTAVESPIELVESYESSEVQISEQCSEIDEYGNHKYKYIAVKLTKPGNVISSTSIAGLLAALGTYTSWSILSGGSGIAISIAVAAISAYTGKEFTIAGQDIDGGYGGLLSSAHQEIFLGNSFQPGLNNRDNLRKTVTLPTNCHVDECKGYHDPTVAGIQVTDPDGDSQYEDLNGNGRIDSDDVVRMFENSDSPGVQNNPYIFDFNENGRIDFDDVTSLLKEL